MTKGIGGAVIVASVLALLVFGREPTPVTAQATTEPHPGQLTIIKDGEPDALCPLEGTVVTAQISGFGARVTVAQTFTNPTDDAIEAIYTFPLPADAAVDRMRMQVGDRTIDGTIARREEARRAAKVR